MILTGEPTEGGTVVEVEMEDGETSSSNDQHHATTEDFKENE